MPESSGAPPPDSGDSEASKVLFGKYELGHLLGCGAFAKVYHARNINNGQNVAVKVIAKDRLSARHGLASNVMREVAIMRRLRHAHVVRLLEVLASRSRIYFVMEFLMGGELFTRLAHSGRLPENQARRYFRQLIFALAHCHVRGVFHRDLKPENLLLDENNNLKVSDFGLGALPDTARGDGMLHTLCGTPAYVAPEILTKKGYDGAKVDVWSCGVILFVLCAGYLPFNDLSITNLYRKIYRGLYHCPKWTSPELKRLLSRLLDTNPATRITINDITHDPWFRKGLSDEELAAMTRTHYEVEDPFEGMFEKEGELNAFDIIAFSSGMDLSGLIGPAPDRDHFMTTKPAEVVLTRAEEVGKEEGLTVRRKKGKKGPGGVVFEGQNGNLLAHVRVHRLGGDLAVVEVEEGGGEEGQRRSREFWRTRLGLSDGRSTPVAGGADDRTEPVS